jgi:hypothetical protein
MRFAPAETLALLLSHPLFLTRGDQRKSVETRFLRLRSVL